MHPWLLRRWPALPEWLRQSEGIHAQNVCVEHIPHGVRGAAVLGIEVEAAGEAASLQHLVHAHGGLVDIEGELVGISPQQVVALIGIDTAQHAVDGGDP